MATMKTVNITDTTICFDPVKTDADGNPQEARFLTAATSFLSFGLLFAWLIALIVNRFRPGTLPKLLALENNMFVLNVFAVANFASCILSMGLWRAFNKQPFFFSYQASLSISQCFLILNHAVATSMHNDKGLFFWVMMEVVFVFYIHYAGGTAAIWTKPAEWLRWLSYDLLWVLSLYLVYRCIKHHPAYFKDKQFWYRVGAVIASVSISYFGWLLGVWFFGTAYGIFYSIWIGFVAMTFFTYSLLVDYLYIEGNRQHEQRKRTSAGKDSATTASTKFE